MRRRGEEEVSVGAMRAKGDSPAYCSMNFFGCCRELGGMDKIVVVVSASDMLLEGSAYRVQRTKRRVMTS